MNYAHGLYCFGSRLQISEGLSWVDDKRALGPRHPPAASSAHSPLPATTPPRAQRDSLSAAYLQLLSLRQLGLIIARDLTSNILQHLLFQSYAKTTQIEFAPQNQRLGRWVTTMSACGKSVQCLCTTWSFMLMMSALLGLRKDILSSTGLCPVHRDRLRL